MSIWLLDDGPFHLLASVFDPLGRGRVAAPFELWDALERAGLVPLDVYRLLCEKTVKLDQGLSILPKSHQR